MMLRSLLPSVLLALLPLAVQAQAPSQTEALRIFKEARDRHFAGCFADSGLEACPALLEGYRRAAAAPDATAANRHDMMAFIGEAAAQQGRKLRERKEYARALETLEPVFEEVRAHYDGGKHFHALIDSQKLQLEAGMSLLLLGRTSEGEQVLGTARRALDRLWDNRAQLTSPGGQALLRKGLFAGEEFETTLGALYRDSYHGEGKPHRIAGEPAALAPQVLAAYRRAEQWLLRKYELKMADRMEHNVNNRYADIKLELGRVLLELDRKKEAEQEFLAASSVACELMQDGQSRGAKGNRKLDGELAERTCKRAAAGWSLASGEADKMFDAAFDAWYAGELARLKKGGKPASPFIE